MTPELRSIYPAFYSNPAIELLAPVPRWTISDKNKRPISFRALFGEGTRNNEQLILGATCLEEHCLADLYELTRRLPDAANHAFFIQSQTDGVAVLDIEADCPDDLKQELLQIPALYAQRSTSGRGYHLVIPLPSNFYDYPDAVDKPRLQDEHKHYEILLHHWTTFTRDMVDFVPWNPSSPQNQQWDDLYAGLASQAVPTLTAHLDISEAKPEITHEATIVELLAATPINKSLADFHHDHSRYEFSVLGTLYNHLNKVLRYLQMVGDIDDVDTYDDTDRVWLIYQAATQIIPHRPKHNEFRNGMPLLFDRTMFIYAGRIGKEQHELELRNAIAI